MVAMISAVTLSLDLGRLYYSQRDLQRAANIAALDSVRVVSGCATATGIPGTAAQVRQEVLASLARNGIDTEDLEVVTEVGREASVVGNAQGLRGFQALADGSAKIDAVRINLSRPTPARLVPGVTGSTNATQSAMAVAAQQAVGSFRVGTTLLSLDSSQSALLGPLTEALLCPMGGAACKAGINLSVADFEGLAAAQLSLGNLLGGATELGLGVQDVSDLLSLELTLPQWLGVLGNGLETAVTSGGDEVSDGLAGLVQGLAGVAETDGTTFSLSEFLTVTGTVLNGPVSPLVEALPFIDGASLLTALGQAATANGDGSYKPLLIDDLGLDIPGVADVAVFLQVGDPAHYAIGPAGSVGAQARSAQVDLLVRIDAGALLDGLVATINGLLNGLLGALGLVGVDIDVDLLSSDLNLGIDVSVSEATGQLEALQCPVMGVNDGLPVATLSTRTAGATVRVGTFDGAATTAAPLSDSNDFPLARVEIDASCVGVQLGSLCLGLNLGSTELALGLELTSIGAVSSDTMMLNDITEFTREIEDQVVPLFRADNPGTDNPQVAGTPTNVEIALGVTSEQTGTGLVGALTGLIDSLLATLTTTVLDGLLDLVNGLASSLIDPLLDLLGVQVGAATVTMDAVTVDRPHLVTTSFPEFEEELE